METKRIKKKKSWFRRAKHSLVKFIRRELAWLTAKIKLLIAPPQSKRRRKRQHHS
jgi:hypothetical protein